MVFAMMKHGKEKWMTPEEFEAHKIYQREACRKYTATHKDEKNAKTRAIRAANPEKYAAKAAEWRRNNPEKAAEMSRAGHAKNREKERVQANQWNKDNRVRAKANFDKWKENNPEMVKAHAKKWLQENKAKVNQWKRERHARDPKFAMAMRCRSRLGYALKAKGFEKDSKTCEMLGCSWEQLCTHLESFFTEEINWSTRDKWHVDHVIPLASAKTMEELKDLAKWTNLQPLLGPENIAKGDKMPDEWNIPVDDL